jgi:citrate lyase subunit beta / citryl-CoA lyase
MRTGTAGRPDSRSDCIVEIEPLRSGGIRVEVESKVSSMYGTSIERLTGEVLRALGLEHARVSIHDQGALPFVLAARIEAAAKRLSLRGEFLPPGPKVPPPLPERDRLRRTRLYLPGDQPKFFPNAGLHRPDAVILDLEDSVHPEAKDAARILVRNALRLLDFEGAERMVRINQGRPGMEDLRAILPSLPDTIVIPKCESPDQVNAVEREAQRILKERSISREFYLLPIIESALGVEHAYPVATASERVCALAIGLEDYTADIGAERTPQGLESLHARQVVLNAAKAAGVQALDSVYSDVDDAEGLERSCREARAMGFDGKGCIHPRQIALIHTAFAPTEREIAWAQQVVLAFEQAQKNRSTMIAVGSKMIDPPVVKRALRQMAQAIAAGKVPQEWRRSVRPIQISADPGLSQSEGD